LFCNVYFFYGSSTSYDDIHNTIKSQPKNSKIITNRVGLKDFLTQNGENAGMLDEIIPEGGSIAKEVYTNARKLTDEYQRIFDKLQFEQIQLTKGIDYQILRLSLMLSKICKILDEKNNITFIFEGIIPIYLSILQYAKKNDYTNTKLGFIHNKKIEYFDENIKPDELYSNKKFYGKKALDFVKLSSRNKFSISNIELIINFLISVSHFKINSFFSKFKRKNQNNIDLFLNKIEQKIKKMYKSTYKTKCLFFITASRVDLYLYPWYPIFNELKSKKIEYMILTSDITTSLILSKENLKFINLFEEVNILTESIKNSEHGLDIIKQVKILVEKNKSVFGLYEMSFYILNSILRSVSIITILNSIMKNMDLKSIITCADGEHWENISIDVAKKMEITSFSALPAVIYPSPWFADWLHSDFIFTHGQYANNTLLGLGYNKNRLLPTGNPKFDQFQNFSISDSKKILQDEIGLEIEKKLIVIGMAKWHDNDEVWMSNFIRFCNKNDFEVIIKIHPKYKINNQMANEVSREKIDKIKENCKPLNFHYTYDLNLYTILSAADIVLTDNSNLGIEAIIFDKPTITLDLAKNLGKYLPYDIVLDNGASKFVQDYSKLENTVYGILKNNEFSDELKNGREKVKEIYNYFNDGKASDRIINYLLK